VLNPATLQFQERILAFRRMQIDVETTVVPSNGNVHYLTFLS